jgi:serine/threonine protein kinase
MEDLVGKTLGKYQIIERIGRGGMADIYRSKQPDLDRDVAIKVLNPYMTAEDTDFVSRFRREGRAAAALRHPNIVQVFDFEHQGEVYFLVMEYIEGRTLKEILTDLREKMEFLSLGEVLRILSQVGDALDYAHQQGTLHRDVKPSNIMINKKGLAILMDFGIARMMSGSAYITTGMALGTPAYMSPEQADGRQVDHRSDLYSLGVVLYEMLAGRTPFEGDTPVAVMRKHEKDPLPPLRDTRPDLPQTVEDVLQIALAKDPDRRFQCARALVDSFQAALEGKPLPSAAACEVLTTDAVATLLGRQASLPTANHDIYSETTQYGARKTAHVEGLDLSSIPLFTGLTTTQLNTIARCLRKRSFRAGDQIFRTDDYAYDLYIIKSGRVRIYTTDRRGEEVDLAYYNSNDLFGERSLLVSDVQERRRTADAMAITETEVFTLGRDDFLNFMNSYTQMSWNMIQILAHHMHVNTLLRQEALTKWAGERLAERLVRMVREGMEQGEGKPILVKKTPQELADLIIAEREVVVRELHKLERKGVVEVTTEGVRVLDFEALRERAEGEEAR